MGKHEYPGHSHKTEQTHGRNIKKKTMRVLLILLCLLLIFLAGIAAAYLLWEKAPDISPAQTHAPEEPAENTPVITPEPTPEPMDIGIAPETTRQDGVYTILLAGIDDTSFSTDTIMVCSFDTVNHKINFVSFPRDTIINVDWPVRKVNSVYWGTESGSRGEGVQALKWQMKNLLGFDLDCYALINLSVFMDAVDALGGVYFDVPFLIEYEDWMGSHFDEWTNVEPGYQLLNGYQCMAVCRHRQSYITGDLGRIELQHKFLKSAAEQFITLGNVPNAKQVINILESGLETDLSAANIAFFLRQALMCSSDDIHFYTMPTEHRILQDYSYAIPLLDEWLLVLNSYLNPYDTRIYAGNLNIIYIDVNGNYHATLAFDGGRWYYE